MMQRISSKVRDGISFGTTIVLVAVITVPVTIFTNTGKSIEFVYAYY